MHLATKGDFKEVFGNVHQSKQDLIQRIDSLDSLEEVSPLSENLFALKKIFEGQISRVNLERAEAMVAKVKNKVA